MQGRAVGVWIGAILMCGVAAAQQRGNESFSQRPDMPAPSEAEMTYGQNLAYAVGLACVSVDRGDFTWHPGGGHALGPGEPAHPNARRVIVDMESVRVERLRFRSVQAAMRFASTSDMVYGRRGDTKIVEVRGNQVVIVSGPGAADRELGAKVRAAAWEGLPANDRRNLLSVTRVDGWGGKHQATKVAPYGPLYDDAREALAAARRRSPPGPGIPDVIHENTERMPADLSGPWTDLDDADAETIHVYRRGAGVFDFDIGRRRLRGELDGETLVLSHGESRQAFVLRKRMVPFPDWPEHIVLESMGGPDRLTSIRRLGRPAMSYRVLLENGQDAFARGFTLTLQRGEREVIRTVPSRDLGGNVEWACASQGIYIDSSPDGNTRFTNEIYAAPHAELGEHTLRGTCFGLPIPETLTIRVVEAEPGFEREPHRWGMRSFDPDRHDVEWLRADEARLWFDGGEVRRIRANADGARISSGGRLSDQLDLEERLDALLERDYVAERLREVEGLQRELEERSRELERRIQAELGGDYEGASKKLEGLFDDR